MSQTYPLHGTARLAMVFSQRLRCAICGSQVRLVADHHHGNGRVRGMLCGNCNTGLGMFGDSPERLRAAADYLEAGAR